MIDNSQTKLSVFSLFAFVCLLASNGYAAEDVNKSANQVAIKGYDAVAYFKQGQPVQGNAKYTHEWMNAKWYFSNDEYLREFSAQPEAFAPQYGGFCAFAMSKGQKADTDPKAWTIYDGKLYLNYNQQVKSMWQQNKNANIQKADGYWRQI